MDISQISIHLKDGEERVGEISLLQPLHERRLKPSKRTKPSLRWIPALIEKLAAFCCPKLSIEAQFKTQVARLLTQELIRDHYLDDSQRREAFFDALSLAAQHVGYKTFSRPSLTLNSDAVAEYLTRIDGCSLLENPQKLAFHTKRMAKMEQTVLNSILSHIERSPLLSGLEVEGRDLETSISLATHYYSWQVKEIKESGGVDYDFFKNRTAPATQSKSTINQGIVLDTSNPEEPSWLGSYCGELGTTSKVLEQVLMILQAKGEIRIVNEDSSLEAHILFTSLYNWREMEEICRQRDAISALNGKTLMIGKEKITLQLYYYNLNSIARLPIPAQMRGFLEDLNDECIIRLLQIEPFCHSFENLPEDFFERRKKVLATIDDYRAKRPQMADPVLQALVHKQRSDGRSLRGMDALLYLEEATKRLGAFHNKNCKNGIDRTSTAKAADKAQNAVYKITKESYLPGLNDHKKLFRVLYSLYLIWEEPEINAALTLGLFGKSFFKRLFYHNPQQEEFLASWAKLEDDTLLEK